MNGEGEATEGRGGLDSSFGVRTFSDLMTGSLGGSTFSAFTAIGARRMAGREV